MFANNNGFDPVEIFIYKGKWKSGCRVDPCKQSRMSQRSAMRGVLTTCLKAEACVGYSLDYL